MDQQALEAKLLSVYSTSTITRTNTPTYKPLISLLKDTFSRLRKTKNVIMVVQSLAVLMVGYVEIMRSLEDAKDLDIRGLKKKDLVSRFRYNPLGPFFSSLKDFVVTSSAEAIDLRQTKARSRTPSPKKRSKICEPNDDDEIAFREILPLMQPMTTSSSTSPSTPISKKRIFSGEFFGTSSTDTNPARLNHAEPHTQALQNDLIKSLIYNIWNGGISVPWAQNRELILDYRPYSPKSI